MPLRQIAQSMGLNAKTIANHQSIIKQKLGAESAVQLIRIAGGDVVGVAAATVTQEVAPAFPDAALPLLVRLRGRSFAWRSRARHTLPLPRLRRLRFICARSGMRAAPACPPASAPC